MYIDPQSFNITTNSNEEALKRAIARYQENLLFTMGPGSAPPSGAELLKGMTITVLGTDTELRLGTDESYTLSIEGFETGSITAETIFGAMRGLESFSQLIDYDLSTTTYALNCVPTSITDSPRFPWRGLLIDTARHYLDKTTIFRAIDAMSWSKFNTLHWHAVDAESFPVVSETLPLLSEEGAYATNAIYTQEFVKDVIAYAYERGIRVVPEFDVPGHTASWGKGYPELIVDCPNYNANINNIPLNPTLNTTYEALDHLFHEMGKLFLDDCFHIGGDEVVTSCWKDNDQVVQWMNENNMNTLETLQYFEDQLAPIMESTGKTPVVWEDLFNYGVVLPFNYIIEVWDNASSLEQILKSGYQAITAYGNYLNNQEPLPGSHVGQWADTWKTFYGNEPLAGTSLSEAEEERFLGGEAAMWGEHVDSTNFDSRVWPRACAIAERLWSPASVTDVNEAKPRLIEHRCRLARRGIGAGPIAPDYCPIPYVPYTSNDPVEAK